MSRDASKIPYNLSRWLEDRTTWKLKVQQGVREDWQRDEEDIHCDWETPWDYAEYVLGGAMSDIRQGTNHLAITIEGYEPWSDDVFFRHIVNPKIML